MPKVSVIIPVYNTEKYLRKCLDSVCNQTLSDIEVICINDCSPDNSLEILQEYAQKDKRIKIIDFKENKGAAVARNTGIDEAQGEYIGFVDPDDYIALNFYEKLYNKAIKNNADVTKGTIHLTFDRTEEISDKTKKIVKKELEMMRRLHRNIQKDKMYFRCMFTTAIYRKSMLESYNIRFIENCICGEDLIVPLKAAVYSNKIQLVDSARYFYLRRENSATTSTFSKKKYISSLLMQSVILDFLNNAQVSKKHYKYIMRNYIHTTPFFEILNLYKKGDFELINKMLELQSKIKYRTPKQEQYFKLLDNYLITKDLNMFVKELEYYRNKMLVNVIRAKIKNT